MNGRDTMTEPRTFRATGPHPTTGQLLDVAFGYPLTPDNEDVIAHWRAEKSRVECRMHDDDERYAAMRGPDGRIPDVRLYLRRIGRGPRKDDVIPCHYPHSAIPADHATLVRMGDLHKRSTDYICRASDRAGHSYYDNKRISAAVNRRPDVVVVGPAAKMGAEVQVTPNGLHNALTRTRDAAQEGVTDVWFPLFRDPAWAFKVPHVETNERFDLNPGSWTVTTGPRAVTTWRCHGACPDAKRCVDGWHLGWEPIPGLTVDDIVERFPAGELVVLDTQTRQGIILATPNDVGRFRNYQTRLSVSPQPVRRTRVRRSVAFEHNDSPGAMLWWQEQFGERYIPCDKRGPWGPGGAVVACRYPTLKGQTSCNWHRNRDRAA